MYRRNYCKFPAVLMEKAAWADETYRGTRVCLVPFTLSSNAHSCKRARCHTCLTPNQRRHWYTKHAL